MFMFVTSDCTSYNTPEVDPRWGMGAWPLQIVSSGDGHLLGWKAAQAHREPKHTYLEEEPRSTW